MIKKWLWLEDQEDSVDDIAQTLEKAEFCIEQCSTPGKLINRLVESAQTDLCNELETTGVILDVLLMGQQYITCPKDWCDGNEDEFFHTKNGYDAGLLLYEKVILPFHPNQRCWKDGPPPVVFLTVLHTHYKDIDKRILALKEVWADRHKIDPKDAKVYWIRKWEVRENPEILVNMLRACESSD